MRILRCGRYVRDSIYENNPDIVNHLHNNQKDIKEIVDFWDANGRTMVVFFEV